MDVNRLGRGEMIASISAIALLLIMFIFTWFSLGGDIGDQASAAGIDTGANAWQVFSFIDIVLFITILVTLAVAAMSANAQSANLPVAGSAVVAGLGILCVILILFRIISPPDGGIPDGGFGLDVDITRGIGVFLGLIAAGGIAYGGWAGMQEEGTSFSAQADRVQNRHSGDRGTGGAGTTAPPPPATEQAPPPPLPASEERRDPPPPPAS